MNRTKQILAGLFLILLPFILMAQPDFSQRKTINDVSCFPDMKKANVAYYAPGKLSLALNREKKPEFNLLLSGYLGTAAYGDQHTARRHNILRFRVKMQQLSAAEIANIKRQLWPNSSNKQLRPVPISDIKTRLVFTALNDEEIQLPQGNLSAENKDGLSQKGLYWKEREFTLRLDDKSAELIWAALDSSQCLMSLSYAFFSEGKTELQTELITDAEQAIFQKLKDQISEEGDSIKMQQTCILADAFSIQINTKKWPELLQKIDINQEVPPAFAALEIRCYDFFNRLRPDLFAKRVEVKAKGVGRGDVMAKVNFSAGQPDIYVYNIRFPYAVRLSEPLYYRITSIGNETIPTKTEWIEKTDWAGMIDISSSENEITETEE